MILEFLVSKKHENFKSGFFALETIFIRSENIIMTEHKIEPVYTLAFYNIFISIGAKMWWRSEFKMIAFLRDSCKQRILNYYTRTNSLTWASIAEIAVVATMASKYRLNIVVYLWTWICEGDGQWHVKVDCEKDLVKIKKHHIQRIKSNGWNDSLYAGRLFSTKSYKIEF